MTTRPRPQAAPPGLTVGAYTLLHRLGEGGMGVVHLAQGPDGRRVALKVLRPHVVGDEEARDRLAREVKSLSRVRSPRVAEIIDADPWGPVPFVATRYVPGLSLHDHVPQEGPLRGADLAHFARCLAEALQAVHRVGVLHRDIKPSNVLMEGRTPVLIDFGLARVAEDDRLTRTGWLLGTPGYLAPEILYGSEPTAAADVHSWAATTAFAGMGRPPFGRGPSMAVMDRVRRGEHDLSTLGPEVRRLVEAALDPEPLARPSLDEVLHALAGPPPPAPSPMQAPIPPTVALTAQARPIADEPWDPWADETAAAPPVTMAPTREPYQEPPPPVSPARIGLGERLRRWTLGLVALGLVAGAVTAAPWVTLIVLGVTVAMLRWCSVIGSSAAARREQRGRKWYDVPLAAVTTPVDLLASIPGTVLVLGVAAVASGCAALLCFAFGVSPDQGLPLVGATLGLALWVGPGAGRVRRPVHRLAFPVARVPWTWLLAVACVGGLAVGLAWTGVDAGTSWAPDQGAPWRAGTRLGSYL